MGEAKNFFICLIKDETGYGNSKEIL